MIVELNLGYYRDLLATETDARKSKTIAGLLAEEEAKLAKLSAYGRERRDVDSSRAQSFDHARQCVGDTKAGDSSVSLSK